MALKSTVRKAQLQVSDMDRHHYATHALILAQHPSETEERLMVRLLAFALNADERLVFGKGLSSADEPDLWLKDYTGEIELWIEVGQPDEQRVRQAAGRARRVRVYCYGGRAADLWWQKAGPTLARSRNVEVFTIPAETAKAFGAWAGRSMELQCLIQDGAVQMIGEQGTLEFTPQLRVA